MSALSPAAIAALAGNAGLLLALIVLYDALGFRRGAQRSILRDVANGFLLGLLGVAVMLSGVKLEPGVIFDVRTVLLSLGALFFGTVPALVAALLTGAYRLLVGGPGAAMGVALIVSSAGIGLAWRHARNRRLALLSVGEFYVFGVVVHLAMLACILLLPARVRGPTFGTMALPALLVYPVATVLVGWVLRSGHARRLGEKAQRRATEILERMTDGFVALDTEWRYTYINAEGAALFGHTPEELIGKHIWTEFPEGVGQPFHLNYEKAMREQEPIFFEDYYEPWDRWFANRVFPSPEGLSIFFHDITDRKRAEIELSKSESRLVAAQRLAGIGDFSWEVGTGEVSWSEGMYELLGYDKKEKIDYQKVNEDIHHPDDLEMVTTWLEECLDSGKSKHPPKEYRLIRKDGMVLDVQTTVYVMYQDGKATEVIGTVQDISSLKRTAARLAILRELDTAILEARTVDEIAMAAVHHLSALVPAERTSLTVFDEEAGLAQVVAVGVLEEEIGGSRTVPIAGAFFNLDGLRAGEVTRIDDLAAVEDLDALSARLREAGIRSMVSVPVRAHGVLLGSLNAAATKPAAFSDADIEVAREVADTLAIALEQARLHEAVVRHAEELESRVAERTAELAARTGEAEKLNRAMLNLLEDLRAEQVRTREIAQRLEISNRELESFAYSVSHDLRAPLRAIDGFGEALAEDLAGRLDERQQDDLGRMRAAARRMGSMIDDLLALSRAGRVEMERQQVDLSKVAGEVVAELREGEPEREVEVTVAPGLTARGDPRLLRLVLQNLIGNAWKFTGRREAAAIELGRRDDGGEGVFYVRDNGVGFDMRYADKLFGAFQRMHRQDEFPGDGIGLATVQRIVARHGGRVWAEAEEGAGATFYFTLNGG